MYLPKFEELLRERIRGLWSVSRLTLLSRYPLPYLTGNPAECVWGCPLTSSAAM